MAVRHATDVGRGLCLDDYNGANAPLFDNSAVKHLYNFKKQNVEVVFVVDIEIEYTEEDVAEILRREMEELERIEREERERRKKLEKAKKKGVIDAEIIDLKFGTFKDFLREDVIKRFNRNPDAEAVRIAVENADLGIQVVRVYRRSLNDGANWRKFLKRYGGKKTVQLKYDPETDRWDILL